MMSRVKLDWSPEYSRLFFGLFSFVRATDTAGWYRGQGGSVVTKYVPLVAENSIIGLLNIEGP